MENTNNKISVVVMAPVGTRSGYGERSRDFVRALIALDKYDIKIISTRWGSTPLNALTDADMDIVSRIHAGPLQSQPDVFIQITVPNEFQRIGKFNIGMTAGIETTICDASWLEGLNRMDLILVSSEHAKNVFMNTQYIKKDTNTGQEIGQLKLEKPIEVLMEGVRLDKMLKTYTGQEKVQELFNGIPEKFNFLFVGHWLQGAMGEDRKNVSGLIKTFLEAFKNKSNAPGLILKTSGGAPSVIDREGIISRINQIKETVTDARTLPNIYVIYGELTDAEMSDLYNHPKVKAHVSLTKGEGYGRPLAEAAITGKPIIVSKWSGHLDFLNEDTSVLIDGTLTKIHPTAVWKGVLNEESEWFTVDYNKAVAYMKDVFKNYDLYLEKSRKTFHFMKTNKSFENMKQQLSDILEKRLPDFPKQVTLKLPQLKKIETPQMPKIQLPQLKKVES